MSILFNIKKFVYKMVENAIPVPLRALFHLFSLTLSLYSMKIRLDLSPFHNPDIWLQHVGHF